MEDEKKKKKRLESSFEFCEVCNRNHDQGCRHKYATSHSRSLSSLLARFQKRLSDLRFFLKNPSLLRREHSSLSRIWCVFCGLDIHEIGSTYVCSNAFNHLASSEHSKNLKDFLRKHGGKMDHVDNFRVSEMDLIKWEKSCKALNGADSALIEGPIGPSPGPLTNEGYSICNPEVKGSVPSTAVSSREGLQGCVHHMHAFSSVPVTVTGRQHLTHGNNGRTLAGGSLANEVGAQDTHPGEDFCRVAQKVTQISCMTKGSQENVHSGALPPWLEASEQNERNLVIKAPGVNTLATSSVQTTKTKKLNPKRVGAAWADKRRIELEMEKQGELVPNAIDINWLPNFGRVWQAGTRKESRKEFEMEKQKFLKDESSCDSSFQIEPYISKRMRTGSPHKDGAGNDHDHGEFASIM
ncbi:TITAN-like protein [Iris pallida]|uniref:TITAN-like protein n=1 Tax=Iris pallida TaxID=29817 RepID=A0AAX6I699_IRIPA|nr:TITAN-like protein [Iris pallida]